jgi:lysozyme
VTSPNLLPDLERDEGLRLSAYPDPLSGGEPWTIGYGHTGNVHPGTVWTPDQASAALQADVAHVEALLDIQIPWWRQLDDIRQDVLVNMGFNLGVTALAQFHNTLAAVKAGNWAQASAGMLASQWARQVPNRADRLAEQMLTGIHQS